MSDPLRYRPVDEPAPGPLRRFALPPLLVFMAALFFTPWGLLLIAANAVTLGGAERRREIVCALAAFGTYFLVQFALVAAIDAGLIALRPATYLMVLGIGGAFVFACFAYVSQARTAALRRYLAEGH